MTIDDPETNELSTKIMRLRAERAWRAVLAQMKADGDDQTHGDCECDPPDECSLYNVIVDAMKGGE